MSDRRYLLKLLATATNFFAEALVAIAIGFFLGGALDRLIGTEFLFTAIFMVIGAVAAVRNLIVRVMRLGERQDNE